MKYKPEIERTYTIKRADSVLLSLFMRTNGKCNNSHDPWHRLKRYSAFHQNIPEGPEYENHINTIQYYFGFWNIQYSLLCLIDKYHR